MTKPPSPWAIFQPRCALQRLLDQVMVRHFHINWRDQGVLAPMKKEPRNGELYSSRGRQHRRSHRRRICCLLQERRCNRDSDDEAQKTWAITLGIVAGVFFIIVFIAVLKKHVKQKRRIYGHAKDVEIRPLDEEKAVQAAADLIGELFIFMVAGTAVIYEVQRTARSEA